MLFLLSLKCSGDVVHSSRSVPSPIRRPAKDGFPGIRVALGRHGQLDSPRLPDHARSNHNGSVPRELLLPAGFPESVEEAPAVYRTFLYSCSSTGKRRVRCRSSAECKRRNPPSCAIFSTKYETTNAHLGVLGPWPVRHRGVSEAEAGSAGMTLLQPPRASMVQEHRAPDCVGARTPTFGYKVAEASGGIGADVPHGSSWQARAPPCGRWYRA